MAVLYYTVSNVIWPECWGMLIKVVPGDFVVEERASLRLVRSGPWAVYHIRKVGLTTLQVQAPHQFGARWGQARGREREKVDPCPISLSTQMAPFMSWAMSRAMANPRPMPPYSRRNECST